jgi:hypothetical protein
MSSKDSTSCSKEVESSEALPADSLAEFEALSITVMASLILSIPSICSFAEEETSVI